VNRHKLSCLCILHVLLSVQYQCKWLSWKTYLQNNPFLSTLLHHSLTHSMASLGRVRRRSAPRRLGRWRGWEWWQWLKKVITFEARTKKRSSVFGGKKTGWHRQLLHQVTLTLLMPLHSLGHFFVFTSTSCQWFQAVFFPVGSSLLSNSSTHAAV